MKKKHLFADIFSRDVLTYQQRELVTVSALAAMSDVAPQCAAAFAIIDQWVSKKQGDIARITLGKVLATQKQ